MPKAWKTGGRMAQKKMDQVESEKGSNVQIIPEQNTLIKIHFARKYRSRSSMNNSWERSYFSFSTSRRRDSTTQLHEQLFRSWLGFILKSFASVEFSVSVAKQKFHQNGAKRKKLKSHNEQHGF